MICQLAHLVAVVPLHTLQNPRQHVLVVVGRVPAQGEQAPAVL